jgi:hypothetical protein
MSADATNPTVVIQDEDGTNNVAVKAASTAAVGADKALVVAVSPNNTVSVSPSADTFPATQNITVVDSASSTAVGANSQSIITGTPTANSDAAFTLASLETCQIQVTGTWTGTLQIELSNDSGTTWYIRRVHQIGTDVTSSAFTANFSGGANVGGYTNLRVRATAAMTGTATVKISKSLNPNLLYIGNAQRITDNAGNYMPVADVASRALFIKQTDGTNTMPSADVAARKLFAAITDGTNSMPTGDAVGRAIFQKITDGTNTAAVKAASTGAAAADPALVVALSPNSAGPFEFGSDNRLRVGQESMALFDTFEGAAVDTRWWTASQSGMTQTVSGGILTLNAGASLTNANYSILNSNKNIRFAVEFGIYYQCRARVIAFANVTQEFGIGSVATNAAPTNGGFFRMVGTTLTGVINHNGTETSTATLATLANASYYSFEIFYYEETVKFEVSGADGVVVAEATIQIPMGQASFSTSSAIPAFFRTYNTGTAGTAGQLLVGSVAVTSMDSLPVFLDTSSLTNVASSASSVNLVTTNPNRKRVNIANDSTQVLFIKFGTTASSTSYTYRLTSNTSISIASEEWSGNIDGIWAAANGNARITEIM